MRPCKFHSTCRVLGVPKNPLKHRIGPKQGVPLLVPSPSHIVHPFYTPSTTEEIVACSTETTPALLDGKQCIPSLLKDSEATTYHLEMSSLKFKCVRGVADWLQSFSALVESSVQSDYKSLDESRGSALLKPCRLSKMKHPLIPALKELFAVERTQKINSGTLDAIIERFVSEKELGVFSEDVYLYLLQHHVNSTEKILTIIESIKQHLFTDIDQLKVVESLVFHILLSLRGNRQPATSEVTISFDGLLESTNRRFCLQDCTTSFQPIVCQEILKHYIKVGNLNESKRIISGLIARRFLPAEAVTIDYLKRVVEQLKLDRTPKGYLKAFALVSDFRPIIERARDPLIFTHLIPFCRHPSEVTSLLSLISKCENAKDILNANLVSFIDKTTQIKASRSVNSANLCSLYRMALSLNDHALPERYEIAFVLSFAKLNNYTMMATIMRKDTFVCSDAFFSALLSKLEKTHNEDKSAYIEGSDAYKAEFFKKFMLPFYLNLPEKLKLKVISQLRTKLILLIVFEAEISKTKNLETDVIRWILKHGSTRDLLCDIPAQFWDQIRANSELRSILSELEPKNVTAE